MALADMFRNESAVDFDTDTQFFVSATKPIGG